MVFSFRLDSFVWDWNSFFSVSFTIYHYIDWEKFLTFGKNSVLLFLSLNYRYTTADEILNMPIPGFHFRHLYSTRILVQRLPSKYIINLPSTKNQMHPWITLRISENTNIDSNSLQVGSIGFNYNVNWPRLIHLLDARTIFGKTQQYIFSNLQCCDILFLHVQLQP